MSHNLCWVGDLDWVAAAVFFEVFGMAMSDIGLDVEP
jgi:hypothetical protein